MSILFFVQPDEAKANCVLLFVLLSASSPALILFALHPN